MDPRHLSGPISAVGQPSSTSGPASGSTGRRIGPYRIERELGRGGFGVVYLGRRDGIDAPVALKIFIRPEVAENLARFTREVELARRLRHPGIVSAIEAGAQGGQPWVAMEYAPGETLHARIARGPIPPDEARALVVAMAEALGYAHRAGVVHRDLKPANVILTPDGPRITDLGLAQDLSDGLSLTKTGTAIGTPSYMAPEQIADSKRSDRRVDLYALGVILYESLSGRRAFPGESFVEIAERACKGWVEPLARVAPTAPRVLVETCERAMTVDPNARYQSAEELIAALRAADAAGRPASGRRSSRRSERSRPASDPSSTSPTRRWTIALAIGCGLLAAIAAGLVVVSLGSGDSSAATPSSASTSPTGSPAIGRSGDGPPPRESPGADALDANERLEREHRDALARVAALEAAAVSLGELRAATVLVEGRVPEGLAGALAEEHLAARADLRARLVEGARARSARHAPYEEPLEVLDLAARLAASADESGAVELERASYLFRRGRLEEARTLAGSLSNEPGRVGLQARYVAAFALVWQDVSMNDGLAELRGIWEDDRDGPVGNNAGAVFHSYSGMNDIGEKLARRSIEIDPEYVDPRISLAFCLNDLSNRAPHEGRTQAQLLAASEASSNVAIELQPDHPRAFMARAFATGNLGRPRDAIAAYSRLIELTEPRPFARALRNRANQWLNQGNFAAARDDFGRALEVSPGHVESLFWRGIALHQLGDLEGALRDWMVIDRASSETLDAFVSRLPEAFREQIGALIQQRRRGD